MKKMARLVVAGALVAGSAAMAQTSETRIQVTKEGETRPLPGTRTTTAEPDGMVMLGALSAGDVTRYRALNEKNVMEHVIVGDSLQVVMGQLAASRGSHAAVRDFGTTLATEHQAGMRTLVEMAKDEDIGRAPSVNDGSARRTIGELNRLRTLSGATFDRAFMRYQVLHHHHELEALAAMRPAAHDDDFEKHLDDMRPALERHLARARDVASQVGITVHAGGTMDHGAHKPPRS